MKSLQIMIKPASSLCNMRCKYCFYADVSELRSVCSFGLMADETMDGILKNVYAELSHGDRVTFVFQGGEPTLAGISFMERFVSIVSKWEGISVSYALQTNGLLLDDEWCAFLKKHRFLVGISYDILPELHDAARVDARGDGTGKRVLEAIACLKKHSVDYNVLCTLTNAVARHPEKVWKRLCETGTDYVQFTPCLDELCGGKKNYALTPKRFASFYIQLFQLWFSDYKNGKYRSVKFFDDVVNLLILGRPTSCGMDGVCRPQLVVEADGSAYPCDFYCLDEYRLGNLAKEPVSKLLSKERITSFTERQNNKPELCRTCPYIRFCGGNCIRMRKEICIDASGEFCGYKLFLDECGQKLAALANLYKQKNI